MNILSLQLGFHDDAAALISGNRIYAIELERLSRIKHNCIQDRLTRDYAAHRLGKTFVKPGNVNEVIEHGLDYLVDAAGLTRKDIDVFFSNRPGLGHCLPSKRPFASPGTHHEIHAAAAFHPSGLQRAAVLVMDVFGSPAGFDPSFKESVSFWLGEGRKLKRLGTVFSPAYSFDPFLSMKTRVHASVGVFYMDLTLCCGFGVLEAGKTMGLSAYGSDRVLRRIEEFVLFDREKGEVSFRRDYLETIRGIMDQEGERFETRADIAYAAQKVLERAVLFYCRRLHEETGCPALCLGGGLALNSAANGLVARDTPFRNLFIQPAAKDSGNALGAALSIFYGFEENEQTPIDYRNFCLGREYANGQVASVLEETSGIRYEQCTDLRQVCSKTVDLLEKKRIIGWFQGGSELGPRALGNRSILCNPALPEMKDILNRRIKFREPFRPFAPAVIEEDAADFFHLPCPSPHMLLVARAKNRAVPAATHVDGSARVQTVNRDQNPRFHALLSSWRERSGLPVLLNTSFNIGGEPLVESPANAVDTFMRSGLDGLIISDFVVEKT